MKDVAGASVYPIMAILIDNKSYTISPLDPHVVKRHLLSAIFLKYKGMGVFRRDRSRSARNCFANGSTDSIEEVPMIPKRAIIPALLLLTWTVGHADQPLEPAPNAVGSVTTIWGYQASLVVRGADLFLRDDTNFSTPDATTTNRPILRAVSRYDVDQDMAFDVRRDQRLTRAGRYSRLDRVIVIDSLGPAVLPGHELEAFDMPNNPGDDILYVDQAVFYDDSERNYPGGFHANWKFYVYPIQLAVAGDDYHDLLVNREIPRFFTMFRGPFWSGEKLEVGDTDGGAFRPQIMHYDNFGIWNWNWFGNEAVLIVAIEGDGGFDDDEIIAIVVTRDETRNGPFTIADTGDIVALSLTDDSRFHRVVLDDSGMDPNGYARVWFNGDTHNADLTLHTRPMPEARQQPRRYVVGPEKISGENLSGQFRPWQNGWFDEGSQRLQLIDNISYIPGWDCGGIIDPGEDIDNDLAFEFTTDGPGVYTDLSHGGCGGKTSVLFRAAEIGLPEQVLATRSSPVRIEEGTTRTISVDRDASLLGLSFSELLAYQTDETDRFSFRTTKRTTATSYEYDVTAFERDGLSVPYMRMRVTAFQWPHCLPAFVSAVSLSTRSPAGGKTQVIADYPVPRSDQAFFVINEVRQYDPNDADMAWTQYYEPLDSHVSLQLGTLSGQNSAGFAESDSTIVQFPVELGLPVSIPRTPAPIVECTSFNGAVVPLMSDSIPNAEPDITPDSLVSHNWYWDGNLVASGAMTAVELPLGNHTLELLVEDMCGFTDSQLLDVSVVDTTPPELIVSVSPDELWPPDHRMKPVQVAIEVGDVCDASPTVTLVSIVSDEPTNGHGDGNTVDDVQNAEFGSDDRVFDLRAERSGRGRGRTYTITYTAEDDSGNTTESTVAVFVPHDRGDDGNGRHRLETRGRGRG